jgi:hypothetical protein
MVTILTVAGLSLSGSAALAKGGNNGSHGSSNFSSRSMKGPMGSFSGKVGTPSQSFKKFPIGNSGGSQIGSSLKFSGPKTNVLPGGNLQGNKIAKKLPKLDQGLGNGKGTKVLDPKAVNVPDRKGAIDNLKKNEGKLVKKNRGDNDDKFFKNPGKNKCKSKCFDNFCWPWFYSSCHSHCYDPCYDSCYYGCFTPYYTTTVVEVPVVIEKQVIVEQPVAAQPALDQADQPVADSEQPLAGQQAADEAEVPAETRSAELMKVAVGATITLRGEAFGEKTGRVAMRVGDLLLGAKVTKWEDKAVTITLQQVGLAGAAKAKFLILKADGKLATEVPFELVPPQNAVAQQ